MGVATPRMALPVHPTVRVWVPEVGCRGPDSMLPLDPVELLRARAKRGRGMVVRMARQMVNRDWGAIRGIPMGWLLPHRVVLLQRLLRGSMAPWDPVDLARRTV